MKKILPKALAVLFGIISFAFLYTSSGEFFFHTSEAFLVLSLLCLLIDVNQYKTINYEKDENDKVNR